MTQSQWTAEVQKMQRSYGAPLDADEIKMIGIYLATVYGDAEVENPGAKGVKIETVPVDSSTVLMARMGANGGQAVRIVPAKQ